VHILNKVFETYIASMVSFVTAVDNSNSYEMTVLFFATGTDIIMWQSEMW